MKNIAILATAIVSLLISTGCSTHTAYYGLKPISPMPNAVRFYAPIQVDSLRPVFKWAVSSPDSKSDLAVWEAVYSGTGPRNNSSYYRRGSLAYYQEGIVGGEKQIETNLAPNTIYFWSIKPTGTMDWSTAKHDFISGWEVQLTQGLFFSIRTPAQ